MRSMEELRSGDTDAFNRRWDAFHDAVVRAVRFDLKLSTVTIELHAQDGDAEWGWREVRLMLQELVEWAYIKPEEFDAQVLFEAGLIWDGGRALFSLDTAPSESPATFRASSAYFGSGRILYEVLPLSE